MQPNSTWRQGSTNDRDPQLCYFRKPLDGSETCEIVFFHGVLRAWNACLPLAAHLTHDYEAWALDHRGHGRSARANRYLVVDYVADAEAWLRTTVVRPVVLYGHSLGAMVAAGVAAACPQQVRGIVLEDPPFQTMGSRIDATDFGGYFRQIASLLADKRSVRELAASLAEVRVTNPGGGQSKRLGDMRDAAALRFFASTLSEVDPRGLDPIVAGRWLDGYDERSVLAGLKCPVLLLQADPVAGGMLIDDDVSLLRELAADVLHVRFPGVGHNIAWQRTQEVANLVHSFIESLKGDDSPDDE